MFEGTKKEKQFSSPEEEIEYLRGQVAEKERALGEASGLKPERHTVVRRQVAEYQKVRPESILTAEHQMKAQEIEEKVLHLSHEHDKKIDELVAVMEERGIKNALSVVEKLGNPHVQDDFHRFLVQYLLELGTLPGLKEGTRLFKALRKKLFQVTLLKKTDAGEERKFSELVKGMEQFYAGLLAAADDKERGGGTVAIEIALSNFESDIIFYCAVPRAHERLFEKHLLAVFPDARIEERKEDYNIFNEGGSTVASYATFGKHPILPLKDYTHFENDPLAIILSAFSKIKKDGEGAAVQFILSPAGDTYTKEYTRALEQIQRGTSFKDATATTGAKVAKEVGTAFKEMFFSSAKKKPEDPEKKEPPHVDEDLVNTIKEKINAPIINMNLRIVASSETEAGAEMILHEIESAFHQFERSGGNNLVFRRVLGGGLRETVREFTFRLENESDYLPINVRELTTLLHFPVVAHAVADLKEERAKQASASGVLSDTGVLLGMNTYQGAEKEIKFAKEDRMRHFYVIGQTGTGKTSLLKNMIVQDIKNGDGVCMIDPHGSDINDILANIPESRIDDVIYFDPAYTSRPMGLNMLEYDQRFPEQKTFVVNELFNIFQKLYGGVPESMGPMFEQYFRNATMLVIEDPSTGNTLLEVSRVMSDANFRKLKLSRCNNPIVKQFWEQIATKAGGEASLANIVPYITSKFDVFMANDIMRPIIAQEKSTFNFRQIMDEQKILLINLSKGRLGEINSALIGLIIVGKILMAALSRVDAPQEQRKDFYLYIDEFQNVTTDSIATILSEARKYRLSLSVAHQFIAQLDEKIKNAVFGNVGSMAVFRVGSEDAEYLEKQFAPTFSASDIMNLENFNAYLKLLINGQPRDAFNIRTLPPTHEHPEAIEHFKELSYKKYGKDRATIEAEIAGKFKTQL